MSREESRLILEAETLKARVERLHKTWRAGAHEAVVREIGTLAITMRPTPRQEAVEVMRAIAKKVMPDGWVYDVIEPIGSDPVFVVLHYDEPYRPQSVTYHR